MRSNVVLGYDSILAFNPCKNIYLSFMLENYDICMLCDRSDNVRLALVCLRKPFVVVNY